MTLPLFDAPALMQGKPPKTLRPYQQRAIVSVRTLVLMGKKRVLCVAPTGSGKMVCIAAIIKSATMPVVFVAHRKEILDHCVRQLGEQGITNLGVIRADDDRYNPSASVQIGSISTLARRDKPFAGQKIIIVIDEAHRAASDSYLELLSHYPDAIVIGFTATPARLDGRPLGGDLFEEIVRIAGYDELLKNPQWLVAPDAFSGRERADLSHVRKSGSDFDEDALAQVMHTARLEGDIVQHWLTRAHLHPVLTAQGMRVPKQFTEGERRRTILFAVNIEHSLSLAGRFEQAGVRVAHLDGNTPERQRDAMLRDLASGRLEIITNCQVAVEGVDIPEIKCVVHARPTHSLTMWRQTVGREMRPWRGVIPLLLDHAGNWDRLGCPFEDLAWSLNDRPKRLGGHRPMKLCHVCFAYVEPSKSFCPFCGAEFGKEQDRAAVPQESQDVLEQRQTEPEALKWAYFWRQVITAKAKGFKPGFASALYKEHYGTWPPRHWSEKIKSDFSSDGVWQTALERRLKRKAERDEQQRREEEALSESQARDDLEGDGEQVSEEQVALEKTIAAIEAPVEEAAEEWPEGDGESPFADWLESEGIT